MNVEIQCCECAWEHLHISATTLPTTSKFHPSTPGFSILHPLLGSGASLAARVVYNPQVTCVDGAPN
ncbi:hypothetical protein J6590_046869 [Homalodisca vitripennis]|nr:hypothetical protein J6590_046869 [Homalodisca vitripennis]